MQVFLTGGTGYVGAHLARALLARGHRLTLLARDPAKIPSWAGAADIRFVRGDLRDAASLEPALRGHHALIHNALIWDEEPTELDLVDPRATIALLHAAQRAAIPRLLYTSSTAVHRPFHARMSASDPLAPADFYGVTKATGELALWAVAQAHGLRGTVIRPSAVVGAPAFPGAPFKSDRRLENLVARARRGERLVVARHDARQWIAACDLAELYTRALETDAGGTILAVARDVVSWEDIAREIVRRVGTGEVHVEDTGLPADPFVFDTTDLDRTFGVTFEARAAVIDHIAHLTR
ncbi:NAD-dependent epimerase/dehydratase family protein [Sandaracinus amylolyticus]|uniref:NAD-dependent epimerase/dehydratase family protein n=1 Tax=Sandaracinus amylolyticus TaxID=927083 RepID=UPI001F4708D6|nr:NAD(P)-dependent oxidoreductase [Sandaracinus amylolyticus]